MIELESKWLAVWLSLEEVFSIFGFGPLATGSSEVWMVAGRIVGESPTGLWLQVENVSNEKNQGQLSALTTATPTYFLPWRRISSARLLDEKPGPDAVMGFRPR
jgi:hypothetical protein